MLSLNWDAIIERQEDRQADWYKQHKIPAASKTEGCSWLSSHSLFRQCFVYKDTA